VSGVTRAGAISVASALVLVGVLVWRSADTRTAAGFWFAKQPFTLFPEDETRIGGPLTASDLRRIEQTARDAVVVAFSGMRLEVIDDPAAFWRVEVVQDLNVPDPHLWNGPPSGAAESFVFGPLGGRGAVSFLSVAQFAIRLAPAGASRDDIITGIGRGIGRAAAHEFAHQIIVGSSHNSDDVGSYEYPYAHREQQYYGELHWTTARAALVKRLGGSH
jgi:hypothetical protein